MLNLINLGSIECRLQKNSKNIFHWVMGKEEKIEASQVKTVPMETGNKSSRIVS
jgi:predicted HAD superfamily hydrolase